MKRSEQAESLFLGGNNCSQSVLLPFLDELELDRKTALQMAAGFGGGMGRMQYTCGAVTGSVMVLGLVEAARRGEEGLKPRSYEKVKEFFKRFEAEHGTSSCKELTGCDFGSEEGSAAFREEGVMEKICAPCVRRAVEIVEDLLAD